jgi:hypothetical protein
MTTPLLCALLLGTLPAGACPTQPDTTAPALRPAPSLKLGVQTSNNGLLPTLSYERPLRPRLTLQASLGYGAHTFTEYYAQPLPDDPWHSASYARRVRQSEARAQLRYYIGRHPKPLTGLYAGLGLGLARVWEEATRPLAAGQTRTRLQLFPQLQVGGQYVVGRHLLLDIFLGLGAAQQQDFAFAPRSGKFWDFYAANGLQVGYAF